MATSPLPGAKPSWRAQSVTAAMSSRCSGRMRRKEVIGTWLPGQARGYRHADGSTAAWQHHWREEHAHSAAQTI